MCYDPVTVETTDEKRFTAFCIFLMLLVYLAFLVIQWQNVRTLKPDFAALYAAGKLLNHNGMPHCVAHGFPVESVININGQPYVPDRLHPPFEMLIFAPLAHINYTAAYLVWYGFNVVMLFSVPILLWSYIPNLHLWFAFVVILVATFFPVFLTVAQGQDSILLLTLLTLCFRCQKERREILGGMVLALGMFKFTLIIPIVVNLAVAKRWRVLAGFATGFLALILATVAMFGFSPILGYLQFMTHGGVEPAATLSMMPNLRGFLHAGMDKLAIRSWADPTALVASVLMLGLFSWRWRGESNNLAALDLFFSAQIVLAAIVSYHLFVHDASILLLPMLLTLNYLLGSKFRTPLGFGFALGAGLMYLVPFMASLRTSMPIFFAGTVLFLVGLTSGRSVSLSKSDRSALTVV